MTGDVEFIRALVGAWDCCGTCAGGVLAQRDRERDARLSPQHLTRVRALIEDESRHLVRWIDGSHLVDVDDLRAAVCDATEEES